VGLKKSADRHSVKERREWRRVTGGRDSSGHSSRIFAIDAACGNRVTEGQEDPRLTGKTHVFNSTYNDDQKSSYTDYIHFNATYNDEQKSSHADYIQLSMQAQFNKRAL
jgi:hypothetical protein